MPLYHTSVYLPADLKLPNGMWTLEYTGHALREATRDKKGILTLPPHIDTKKCQLIEVETDGQKRIQKLVYKTKMSSTTDLVLAIIPMRRQWIVKTVWGEDIGDNHKSLKTSRYDRS